MQGRFCTCIFQHKGWHRDADMRQGLGVRCAAGHVMKYCSVEAIDRWKALTQRLREIKLTAPHGSLGAATMPSTKAACSCSLPPREGHAGMPPCTHVHCGAAEKQHALKASWHICTVIWSIFALTLFSSCAYIYSLCTCYLGSCPSFPFQLCKPLYALCHFRNCTPMHSLQLRLHAMHVCMMEVDGSCDRT
jgi:hypothetical protein